MNAPKLDLDEQLACYRLLLEGKWEQVEYWSCENEWKACAPYNHLHWYRFTDILRRKPAPQQPKYRPWKDAGEVPLGAWYRSKIGGNWTVIISGVMNGKILFPYDEKTSWDMFSTAFDSREHSIDRGKTWLPCGVRIED